MLRKKNILLNDTKANGNETIKEGDIIKLFLSEDTINKFQKETDFNFEKSPPLDIVDIILEDENIIILNKPKGILSQPNSDKQNSLIDSVLSYLHEKGEYLPGNIQRPGLANRLDKNTNGLVICGKNLKALQALNAKETLINKYYFAIVKGKITEPNKHIGYITKENDKNKVTITKEATTNSKEIVTQYKPLEVLGDYTLVEILITGGKPHQIRGVLSYLGHPILGDPKYGGKVSNHNTLEINNQILQAYKLHFINVPPPLNYLNNTIIKIEAGKDISKIIKSLKTKH